MTKKTSLSQSSTSTGSISSLEELTGSCSESFNPSKSSSSELRHRSHKPSSDSTLVNNPSDEKSNNAPSLTQKKSPPPVKERLQMKKSILLLVCASGICTCYLYFGIVQERLLSKESPSSAILDKVGSITSFMLLLSSTTNVIVARLWLWLKFVLFPISSKEQDGRPINHKLLLGAAFAFSAAMSSSNDSLGHVSYPTAVLAKSSKLIPTMLVGFFYERKSFAKEEWYSAALITGGIISFNFSRMSSNEKKGSDSMYGLFLLFLSLVMDGFLASFQGMLKNNDKRQRCRAPMAIENMLWINLYALVFFLPLSIYSGQFFNGVSIFNPSSNIFTALDTEDKHIHEEIFSIQWTIIRMNLTAAVGQIFIFLTVQFFSPLMCTTITTTRKFMTILLSVWRYGHHFTNVQWGSVIGVFGGLYLAIASKLIIGNSTKKLS